MLLAEQSLFASQECTPRKSLNLQTKILVLGTKVARNVSKMVQGISLRVWIPTMQSLKSIICPLHYSTVKTAGRLMTGSAWGELPNQGLVTELLACPYLS